MNGTVLEFAIENIDYGSSGNSINCDPFFRGAFYYWSRKEKKRRW